MERQLIVNRRNKGTVIGKDLTMGEHIDVIKQHESDQGERPRLIRLTERASCSFTREGVAV